MRSPKRMRKPVHKKLAQDWSSIGRADDDHARATLDIKPKLIFRKHRSDDWHEKARWELTLNLRLWIGVDNASSSGGGGMRSVTWRRLRVFLDMPGYELMLKWYWPCFEESMEDYLHDMDLGRRKSEALKGWLTSIGCAKPDNIQVWELIGSSTRAERVDWVDGRVGIRPALAAIDCRACRDKHALYDQELFDLISEDSRGRQRLLARIAADREAREAEKLAKAQSEVAPLLMEKA